MAGDFPLWLRVTHFLTVIFIVLLIRSGLEIFSAHPKLYLDDDAKEGSEWFRWTKKRMPKDKLWTSTDEEEAFSPWVALPGRGLLGLGRHWHFFSVICWIGTGVVYVVLLFATGEWTRLVPTSWSIFPAAINTAGIYLSGHFPPPGDPYNPLQQLTYFGVVFILGPVTIATGAAMSPHIDARYPWYPRIFHGRQTARSLHFLCMAAWVLFAIGHTAIVLIERFPDNLGNILLGTPTDLGTAILLFVLFVVVVAVINVVATVVSHRRPRLTQDALGAVIEPVRHAIFREAPSKQNFSREDITPYFRVNGRPPPTPEFQSLQKEGFASWKLRVHGLVDEPREFTMEELKAMPRVTQITEHSCIQGWTAVAEWGGVQVAEVLRRCGVRSNARYAVFHSLGMGERDEFGHGDPSREYYEVLAMDLAIHEQSILAYEMNDKPLPVEYGAPLRLRAECQLGYKMVKWLRSIELVEDYRTLGDGRGGYREDVIFFGVGASI